MANPYTPGTEKYKLFAYASAKGCSDKASKQYAEASVGLNLFDTSGGTAVARTNLPVSSTASPAR